MGNIETVTGTKCGDHVLKEEAIRRAQADPLPGPLTNAFAKGAIMVGKIPVRKCVASDWEFLKVTNSPLLEIIQSLQQNPKETPPTENLSEESAHAVCWQFMNHPKRVREIIAAGTLAETVQAEVSDEISAPVLRVIFVAAMEQMGRVWKTALGFSAELEEKGEITFFQNAGATKTASAGG